MHVLQSSIYLTIVLLVSGIIITHLQEHKKLSVAIVEKLELI